MNIQELEISPEQMRRLIIAILSVEDDRSLAKKSKTKKNTSNKNTKSGAMAKDHGKQIKDDAKYEALRREGASKEKAARIANTPRASKRGGQSSKLEQRTKEQLLEEAKKIGLKGRHQMKKDELVEAIRNH